MATDPTVEQDLQQVRAVMEAHPTEPWAAAWRNALMARDPVPLGPTRAAGLLYAASTGDWEPRFRDPVTVRSRILVATHLARLADHWGREQDLALEALAAFAAAEVPPHDLEHVELPVVLAAMNGERRLPDGQRVQLTWRNQSGAALAWALGAFRDIEDAAAHADELALLLPSLPLAEYRPMEEIREVLAQARAEVVAAPEDGRRRAVLVERTKALRWLTEPWWPELSLTPWKPDDSGTPSTPAGFDALAVRVKMGLLAPQRPDETLRPGPVVFEVATRLLLEQSYLADAARRKDLHTAAGLMMLLRELPPATQPPDEATGRSEALKDRVWLSAAADALFWATGLLESMPTGDASGDEYKVLLQMLTNGTLQAVLAAAGVRSRPALISELDRQRRLLDGARPGTMRHRYAAERSRALRWILERRWASVTTTPWDGSETPSTPPAAPLTAPLGRWLGLAAAVVMTGFLAACGGGWMVLH